MGKRILILFFLAVGCVAPLRAQTQAERLLEVEQTLAGLGYWIVNVDGKADASTYHAIMAFQKVEGLKRTGKLSRSDLNVLRSAKAPVARYATEEAHIEVDLTRQVLFYVDSTGSVSRILPVSSGNDEVYFDEGRSQIASTPRGHFKIERRINGVRKASLGDLYYPNYFSAGVAIHGSNSIPSRPASHGCVRIPRFADREFFSMTKIGMEVYVYDSLELNSFRVVIPPTKHSRRTG